MKRLILIAIAMLSALSFANAGQCALSPLAQKLNKEISQINDGTFSKRVDFNISAMIKFSGDFDFATARELGISFPTIAGKVATAQIPMSAFSKFIKLGGIEYLDVDQIAAPTMDSARSSAHIEEVMNGVFNNNKYFGDGVVLGVIDAGFDYTHPAFYDAEAKQLIIKRVWEQGKAGNAPNGFGYGSELTTPEEIINAAVDSKILSHGTHVAAICAGTKVQGAEKYYGIAPKADLVIVALKPPAQSQWKSTSGSDIIDGVNYIFKYAESVNKPAIVNLSWGGPMGPHDGTSLFAQALDKLVGKGKIFASSAGNSGLDKIHLNKEFTDKDTILSSYITIKKNDDIDNAGIWIDSWGDSNKTYSLRFSVFDLKKFKPFFEAPVISCEKDTTYETIYKNGADSCSIFISSSKSSFNGKPRIFINVEGNKNFTLKIDYRATSGKINVWNMYINDYYGIVSPFEKYVDKLATAGNTDITLSDLCSGKRAIAVGAYTSKANFKNILGQSAGYQSTVNAIATFSSKGPSTDNRIKPDVCAPGHGVIAGVNSFDPNYNPTSNGYSQVICKVNHNGKEFPYAILSGTSMSCPVTSGAIALMLSIKPDLTPEDIIDLFKRTSEEDSFTGKLPNNIWGQGKLNLHKIFKTLLGMGAVEYPLEYNDIKIFPNPFTDFINISNPNNRSLGIELINVLGETISTAKLDGSSSIDNLKNLNAGIYYLIITENNNIVYRGKLIKQ